MATLRHFATPDSRYIVSGTRFSVPLGEDTDVAIDSYKENFKSTLSFITADKPGEMDIAFQILMPGFNYDLGRAGKGPSDGWFFFTTYNSEQAYTQLEFNASKNDKDFIAAVNHRRAEQCVAEGKAEAYPSRYMHNYMGHDRIARATVKTSVRMLDPRDCEGEVYFLHTPKSPHGVDVDPSGEYSVAGPDVRREGGLDVGNLLLPVRSARADRHDWTRDGVAMRRLQA